MAKLAAAVRSWNAGMKPVVSKVVEFIYICTGAALLQGTCCSKQPSQPMLPWGTGMDMSTPA